MILEALVTTLNADASPHLAPMGPHVDRELTRFTLKPFQTSTTFENLRRHGEGVLHVTDDVELIARAAVGRIEAFPEWHLATGIRGAILNDACRWFAFRVTRLDDSADRATLECEVIDRGTQRDFFGFNRAKHAVLEVAILATRVHLLPAEQLRAELQRLAIPVQKTAGDQEARAFEMLRDFIEVRLRELESIRSASS